MKTYANINETSLLSYRFTQIVADSQIKTPGGKTYDVIFVGTGNVDSCLGIGFGYQLSIAILDHGKIIKTVNAESADSNKKVSSVVIEELDVLAKSEPIRNLEIVRTTQYGKLKQDMDEFHFFIFKFCFVFFRSSQRW